MHFIGCQYASIDLTLFISASLLWNSMETSFDLKAAFESIRPLGSYDVKEVNKLMNKDYIYFVSKSFD